MATKTPKLVTKMPKCATNCSIFVTKNTKIFLSVFSIFILAEIAESNALEIDPWSSTVL